MSSAAVQPLDSLASADVVSSRTVRVRQSDRRYALLDILRYVTAVMVAVMHWGVEFPEQTYSRLYALPVVGYLIRHGALGVPIFFVISGVVIMESATRVPGWMP